MAQIGGVSLYCPRGQCILILLAACKELGGGPSKDECLAFIAGRGWFNKDLGQDLKPYPGSTSKEPRWKTLFAWARQDAADNNYILRGDTGFWPISKEGKEALERNKAFLCGNIQRLRLMFLATQNFKSYIWPGYQVTGSDVRRPPSIYEDDGKYMPHSLVRLVFEML